MAGERFEYEIRQAKMEDIPMIMEYIHEDWRQGHILSVNRVLFEYEFLEADGTVNMVIAINQDKKCIDGCLGYLKTSYGTETFDLWGSVWKVRKEAGNLLGLQLLEYVQNIPGNRYYFGIGMNPNTSVRIHEKLLKEYAGKMRHWYCLAERNEYQLAVVKNKAKGFYTAKEASYEVRLLDQQRFTDVFDQIAVDEQVLPHKNREYYLHRFYLHPIYKYQVYGIFEDLSIKAFFILREDSFKNRSAIRMVDYFGDESCMYAIESVRSELFGRQEVEYLDFYEYGYSQKCLEDAGFCLLQENDENIIPNYFGPFVQENIDIWVTSPVKNVKFVKGDGDQDRPNKSC